MEMTDLDESIILDVPDGWLAEDEDDETRLFYLEDREEIAARISVMAYQMQGQHPPADSDFAPDKFHAEVEKVDDGEEGPYVAHTWTRTLIDEPKDMAFVMVLSLTIEDSAAQDPDIPELVQTWELVARSARVAPA